MKLLAEILGIVLILFMCSCEKYWDDHYNSQPETVDQNVWEALQDEANITLFIQFVNEYNYDTLFLTNDTYSLFIPVDDAFREFLDTGQMTSSILDYHISLHFIQSGYIQGKRKIQTLAEKFALFEKYGNSFLFDGIPVTFESPLYRNGKFFIIDKVGLPKPNLYEYFAVNNPVLKSYFDSQDSIILDKEKSRPIGFDDFGNTIYDTVSETINIFEKEYFPVSEEFRNKTATIVFPLEDDYNAALTEMALALGSGYQDYNDIPLIWQYEELIPYLLEHGVFENMLEESDFMKPPGKDSVRLKNILGDSIFVSYQPVDKAICSNGYAYNYADFSIPDTLFSGSVRYEAEWLLDETGINKYVWNEEAKVISDLPFEPRQEYIPDASNDSILTVYLTNKYSGTYSVEFNVDNLFPRKYQMIVRTHMNIGGIYDIYVNDELVKTFDYYDYILWRGLYFSVTGERYLPEGSFNIFDCWVENIYEYGKAKIRFEYNAPGNVQTNGLVVDYIEFIPAK